MCRLSRVIGVGLFLLGLALLSLSAQAQNMAPVDYRQARDLMQTLHTKGGQTLYCQCPFQSLVTQKQLVPDLGVCGLTAYSDRSRAMRIEWEHIVPASRFGRSFDAWTNGHTSCQDKTGKAYKGRACARKVSATFNIIEGDLHNLAPAIGMINAARGNRRMGELAGEALSHPPCDFEVRGDIIEPRPDIRGDIARTYFYMAHVYPDHIQLSDAENHLFTGWAQADPVDDRECHKEKIISALQGRSQIIVARDCAKPH